MYWTIMLMFNPSVISTNFRKVILYRDLAQQGLTCEILHLRGSHFRKLNMVGNFSQLQSLNLDFSASLTSFREECFACMPNVKFLSLCETRITNLWTTCAALSKLPCLTELRFQNCLCLDISGRCTSSSGEKTHRGIYLGPLDGGVYAEELVSNNEVTDQHLNAEEEDIIIDDINFDQSTWEYSSDDSEVDFSSNHQDGGMDDIPDSSSWNELVNLQHQVLTCPLFFFFFFGFE